jgi:hypothetical protein
LSIFRPAQQKIKKKRPNPGRAKAQVGPAVVTPLLGTTNQEYGEHKITWIYFILKIIKYFYFSFSQKGY